MKRRASGDAGLRNGIRNQTKKRRGGGSGGGEENKSAKKLCCGSSSNCAGGNKFIFPATGGYSIFKDGATASDFFSAFLAAAMALHMQHGCSPSKVSETDLEKDSLVRLAASIVVHATVCSAAQCAPVVRTSTVTIKTFRQRANTGRKLRDVVEMANYFSAIHTNVPDGTVSNSQSKSGSVRCTQPQDAGPPMVLWSAVPWI
jgi:hypothetical protein